MLLSALNIPIALNTSKNDLIEHFFVPLLKNSILYDRGVGYFSSHWIKEAFTGMLHFAQNQGKARWITSPILSQDDWDAIQFGNEARQNEIIRQSLQVEFLKLSQSMQQDAKVALAWMIADGIIEFKFAKPKNKLNHEYHAKIGIFTDYQGNKISFDGSYNDSVTGLHNYESIKIFRSWDETSEYVAHESNLFEMIWNNQDPNIAVYEIPEAIKSQILELREEFERPYRKPEWVKLHAFAESIINTPLPYPHLPETIILRDYQETAIANWFEHKCRGIFEMATGTGKTITALAAAIRLLGNKKSLFTIIISPYIHLCQQWLQEAEKFGYRPLLVAQSKSTWLEDAQKLVRDFNASRIAEGSFIVTNNTFMSSAFQKLIEPIWDRTLIIADEVHHCGSPKFLSKLPNNAAYRLGLSATPIRTYDLIGTDILVSFFGNIIYKLTLQEAIENGFLTPYQYYPIPVNMQDDEFDEFIRLTHKLNRLHPDPGKPMSESALRIAIMRSKVLNNSKSKIEWLRENIDQDSDINYTLFYVGDQIFDEVRGLLGYEKRIPIHEFTYRQNLSVRKDLIRQFQNGDIKAFVAMKCLDEGVDIPPTRVAYFLASSSVEREFIQRRGRVLRKSPGKTHSVIYDLISIPPNDYIVKGKSDENYKVVRSALRREFSRIKEFGKLAENKHQVFSKFIQIADKFDLLSL